MSDSKKVTILIKDTSTGESSKIRYKNWSEVTDHARMVILGQVVNELYEIAMDYRQSIEANELEEMQERIQELKRIADLVNHPRDEAELRDAIESWDEYVGEATMFTVIEIL